MGDSWLGTFSMGSNPDMVAAMERFSLSRALFSRANALEPDNPRVLGAKGSCMLFAQAAQGGSITRAREGYQQQIKEAAKRGEDTNSQLPDW